MEISQTVEEVELWRLRPSPENPRWIAPDRLEDLKRALVADPEMLMARPLLALPDGTVFAGNQRLRAAQELGWETIPVLYVDLDPGRARLWALRDNNPYGEWDEPALAELLAELAGSGVDLALTGFDSADLDRILAGLGSAADPDDAPQLPSGKPDSKPGEIYELGRNRLLCGDARSRDQMAALMDGERAELLLTDPPFGVEYVGRTPAALTLENDEPAGIRSLLDEAFLVADAALQPGARIYLFSPAGPLGTVFRLAIEQVGWQLHESLVWVKDAIVLGHCDYHYRHEEILYSWKLGPGRPGRGRHPGSRWYGGNNQGSVFFVDRPKRSAEHPTMKPVELIAAMLRNSSRRDDLILDPFAGSGSTLIASELLGRRCLAVEIDPRYCDVIRRRYQEFVDGPS